jgi:aryl-alcohol dehydrogenase-like predicted oxidoreductase
MTRRAMRPRPGPRHGITRAEFLHGAAGALGTLMIGEKAMGQGTREKMQTRTIPSSGALLPVIGCGTWRGFDVGSKPAERAPLGEVLDSLFEAGGSVIDSSPMYGRAEAVVGDLLSAANARRRAFVATKVWTRGRAEGIAQMQRSMSLLRSDHIELMQFHNLLDWKTHLTTLRGWKEEGRITYVGVTHYTSTAYDELEAVMRAEKLDFVQLNYAADDRAAEKRLLPLAADRGIAVLVNQPFGGGGLLQSLRGRPLPEWCSEIDCASWAQVLLKFALGHPAVTAVIPGTGRPEHMRDNIQAGFGRLPDREMVRKIAAAVAS